MAKNKIFSNQISSAQGYKVPFVVAKEQLITPSDTEPLVGDFLGCNLYVNVNAATYGKGVNVTMSLIDSPDVFITRNLAHGYHPICVFQIKETGTDIASASFIGQI